MRQSPLRAPLDRARIRWDLVSNYEKLAMKRARLAWESTGRRLTIEEVESIFFDYLLRASSAYDEEKSGGRPFATFLCFNLMDAYRAVRSRANRRPYTQECRDEPSPRLNPRSFGLPEGYSEADLRMDLESVVSELSPRYQRIYKSILIDGESIIEVARRDGVSRQAVQQVLTRVRSRIREFIAS